MKVLETILSFFTVLARIIFPRKPKPAAQPAPCPCPAPLPAPAQPALAPDAGDGSDDDLYRSDPLALHPSRPGKTVLQPADIAGCLLMIAGSAGCLYKWFVL